MSEWKTVRLGDVCEILNGYAFKSDKYVDSGIRVIRITNVQKGFIEDNSPAFYPITEKETLKDYELHENDLLISLTGNVGRVALLSKEMLPAALNQRVGCIRIRDKNLLISYLFTFLNSDKFESDCIYSARGIAQKNMSTEWLKNYLIPLPPIEVQIKIANNLNTCSKIIKKHNKQLNNFDLLIKSRFIEMFGNPIQNPMNWPEKTVSSLCNSIYGGGTPSKKHLEYYTGDIPWVSSKDMKSDYIIDSLDHITQEAVNNSSAKMVPINSIIMVIRSGILKHTLPVAINKVPITVNQDLKAFIPSSEINVVYMARLFKMIEKDVLSGVRAVTADNIEFDTFKARKIPLPPLTLQTQFATFVQQVDKSKFEMEKIVKLCYTTLM